MKKEKKQARIVEETSYYDDLIEGPIKIPEKKPKLNKRLFWIIGGALLIVLIIVISLINNAAKVAAQQTVQTDTLKRGELVAVVGATGTVRANQSATLSWQTTGRIEKINFEVGDQVASGEVMASLAQSSLPQSVILASSDLFNAKMALEKVKDSSAARSAATLALAKAQSDYNKALGNYWNSNQTQGSVDQITITRAKLQLLDNKIEDLQKKYDSYSEREDTDTRKSQALADLTQAKMDRDTIKKTLDYYEAMPDQLDLQTLEAQLNVAKAGLEDAQREYNRLKNGADPDELAAAEARVTAIEATIGLSTLKAPFSGVVTEVNSMVGDLVSPGVVTYRIDDLTRLMVDIEVPEVDINSIKVGQTAVLTFDAIPNKQYSAKVTRVDRVGDAISGVVQFEVNLEILNPDDSILPGMTAAVNITVQNKQDVLLVPNRSIRLVNDQYVIYVIRNGVQTMVPIEIGSTSDANTEIVSGDVKEGDLVILNPSSSFIDLMQSQSGVPGMGG